MSLVLKCHNETLLRLWVTCLSVEAGAYDHKLLVENGCILSVYLDLSIFFSTSWSKTLLRRHPFFGKIYMKKKNRKKEIRMRKAERICRIKVLSLKFDRQLIYLERHATQFFVNFFKIERSFISGNPPIIT